MKLNATAAIITILCVTVSTFDGIESKTVASATQIGSTGEKRAVDCEWSAWSPWDDFDCKNPSCLKKHQRDKTKIQRRVVFQMEMYGGRPCKTNDGKIITDHSFRETVEKPCNTPRCPKVAAKPYWSAWKDWGPCEDAAETPSHEQEPRLGIRKRTRDCQLVVWGMNLGNAQPSWGNLTIVREEECKKSGLHGTSMDEENCNRISLSFPPWGDWTSWSHCSATCGHGKKNRSRRCNVLPGIDGKFEICEIGKYEWEKQICSLGPC